MVERQSMTTPEVVARTLITEHTDFLREAVAAVAAQLMEAEISAEIGDAKGEVAETRSTHHNGYRQRPGQPGSARSSWLCRGSGVARATSRASSNRAKEARRRSSAW